MGSVSQFDLQNEQLRQQELAIMSQFKDQQRVEKVGYPLLRAALPICGPGATTSRSGMTFANVYSFNKEYQPAARAIGFSDTAMVVGITKGSAAERAGVAVGDRILSLGSIPLQPGKNTVTAASENILRLRNKEAAFAMTVRHGLLGTLRSSPSTPATVVTTASPASASATQAGSPGASTSVSGATGASPAAVSVTAPDLATGITSLTLGADTLCDYALAALKDEQLNAWADGKTVYVTSAMLRFAADDDELAVVLGHEISHNAMKHMDAKKKNMTVGALFGAILDVAAATQGVNTQGTFTNQMAAAGAQVFSQDFEREADYVGMYVLARAKRPYATAADFWRRMAQEAPGSIKFATTHPTTAERFLRLDKTAAEIQAKEAAGQPIMPELKK